MNDQQVMTVKEVADYLHLANSTVYRLIERGKLPAFRVGTGWRFDVGLIEQWRFTVENRDYNNG